MSDKKGLPRPPLFTSDYIALAEILDFALDRFGKLILALMYYTSDGTVPDDLPDDLRAMFAIYQRKIDAAREKYERTCTARAENGRKGGKAKAENAREKATDAKFKPLTQKQLHAAVDHFMDDGSIQEDIEDYDIDRFFDELKETQWSICGEPIQKRTDWEAALREKFTAYKTEGIPHHWHYMVFSSIFSEFHGLRDENGESHAEDAESDFMDTYDPDTQCWNVREESFPQTQWEKALAHFMEQYSIDSNA